MDVRVKVVAGAKKEKLLKIGEHQFEISVKEKAERNNANHRVMKLLSLYYRVSVNKISLRTGHHSPRKRFHIDSTP